MAADIVKSWQADIVDTPSTTVPTKIAILRGGESITLKSLAGAADAHFLGPDNRVSSARGFKLFGRESATLEIPESFGKNNVVEIWAIPTVAGDDVSFFKLINVEPLTAASP